MQQKRRKRLFMMIWVLGFVGLGMGSILFTLRHNINVYVTPSELLQLSDKSRTVMLGGMVLKGSFKRIEGVTVQFKVTDFQVSIDVEYTGVMPALFREGQGVIMTGHLGKNNHFLAKNVLAKHDENYHPPNVPVSVSKRGKGDD